MAGGTQRSAKTNSTQAETAGFLCNSPPFLSTPHSLFPVSPPLLPPPLFLLHSSLPPQASLPLPFPSDCSHSSLTLVLSPDFSLPPFQVCLHLCPVSSINCCFNLKPGVCTWLLAPEHPDGGHTCTVSFAVPHLQRRSLGGGPGSCIPPA